MGSRESDGSRPPVARERHVGLALGRPVQPGSLDAVLSRLVAAAPDCGYRVTACWPNSAVSYASWRQLLEARRQQGVRLVPAKPADMLPAVQESRAAGGLELSEAIRGIGGLAVRSGKVRRDKQNFVVVRLTIAQPEVVTQLAEERAAVLDALAPGVTPDTTYGATKLPAVPLLEVRTLSSEGGAIAQLRDAAGPLPDQLELGPLAEFDSKPVRL